ncbi:MAG: cob(I)yrinic acid a,c-diamide adenosyltransferase [Elusimicrobia bacterium]|nr:cob(I)yrinic acid a,c-diamide adenosyltransferase [Elusimicrobiota bacterium]
MKIYTKTGDKGETGLWGGERVSKTHPRVLAYGDVDEANSAVGAAIAALPAGRTFAAFKTSLNRVQEELFVVGALLATPAHRLDKLAAPFDKGLGPDAAERLEREIDAMTADLEPLKRFILPGGSQAGSLLHLARTVCRRAERQAVELSSTDPVPDGIIVYLNRLSDFLFTAARWVNRKEKRPETEWVGLAKKR